MIAEKGANTTDLVLNFLDTNKWNRMLFFFCIGKTLVLGAPELIVSDVARCHRGGCHASSSRQPSRGWSDPVCVIRWIELFSASMPHKHTFLPDILYIELFSKF